ncbi:MAG: dTMP kinase, partial [Candidatus Omnitrophota bacterium]|nr:dTMP kinase [Candidatus Omnitrophota bacterium]
MAVSRPVGKFITFEGSEGSGKSTQAALVCDYLKGRKKPVLFLREPGGVRISEEVRRILLSVKNTDMADECETLLYMAARAQLVKEVIRPALKQGKIILCDRFLDSTVVYQGYGNGVDIAEIKRIGKFATGGIAP